MRAVAEVETSGAPEFPDQFGSLEEARAFCHPFFTWYNTAHRHGGIGLLTPAMVHYGQAEHVRAQRATVLAAAYAAHPERFVRCACGSSGAAACGAGGVMAWERGCREGARGRAER